MPVSAGLQRSSGPLGVRRSRRWQYSRRRAGVYRAAQDTGHCGAVLRPNLAVRDEAQRTARCWRQRLTGLRPLLRGGVLGYRADQEATSNTRSIRPRRGGAPFAERSASAGGDVQKNFVAADGRVLYRSDQELDDVVELFSIPSSDADGDAVLDYLDNCPSAANSEQGPAVFGQELRAIDLSTFVWPVPSEIVHMRGPLDAVGEYAVDFVESLPGATAIEDPDTPSEGEGWYYLVRPDCVVGSWQSSLDAEPGRDAALP